MPTNPLVYSAHPRNLTGAPLVRIGSQCPPGLAMGLGHYGAARECRLALARAQRAWRAHQSAILATQSEVI